MIEVTVRPPNAIVFISDPNNEGEEIPEYVNGQLVSATSSCVSVGTCPPMDGDTTIRLADSPWQVEGEMVFGGEIETPSGQLSVSTSELEVILRVAVPGDSVRLEVWVDNEREPTILTVYLSADKTKKVVS